MTLHDLIEAERERFGVPGCAVAVVKAGEVLLADGFGLRNLDSGQRVGAHTLFPIASDTKCFTAALLCQLAAAGELDLDAPVRDTLPWFRMADEVATQLVSVRDLLAHRSGLPRHDFVWYGETDLTLESVARSLVHLPLSRQPRQTWQYNNLAYSTAGHVTEVVTGEAWHEAVRSRILGPLGMGATTFWEPELAAGDFAMPYSEVAGELVEQGLPAHNKLLPPGGIVSSAADLAPWLLARLGGSPDVLSVPALANLHAPTMIGGAGIGIMPERASQGYALGCQVEAYRGHTIVFHGGNLVGYSSNVAVSPTLGVGVAILTNRHGTFLRDAIVPLVVDHLAGLEPLPWGERYHQLETTMRAGARAAKAQQREGAAGRPPVRPVAELAGTYTHPAYGDLVLVERSGALATEFHGLGDRFAVRHRDRDAYELDLPELEATFALTFRPDADDSIGSLTVPLEAMVEAIVFERQPPAIGAELLESAPGTYVMGPLKATVRRVGDVLEMSAPTLGTVRLIARHAGGFGIAGQPAIRVSFGADTLVVVPVGIFTRS